MRRFTNVCCVSLSCRLYVFAPRRDFLAVGGLEPGQEDGSGKPVDTLPSPEETVKRFMDLVNKKNEQRCPNHNSINRMVKSNCPADRRVHVKAYYRCKKTAGKKKPKKKVVKKGQNYHKLKKVFQKSIKKRPGWKPSSKWGLPSSSVPTKKKKKKKVPKKIVPTLMGESKHSASSFGSSESSAKKRRKEHYDHAVKRAMYHHQQQLEDPSYASQYGFSNEDLYLPEKKKKKKTKKKTKKKKVLTHEQKLKKIHEQQKKAHSKGKKKYKTKAFPYSDHPYSPRKKSTMKKKKRG